jgi:hypothetical protein
MRPLDFVSMRLGFVGATEGNAIEMDKGDIPIRKEKPS